MKIKKLSIVIWMVAMGMNGSMAGNPIVPDFGMADPHAYQFEDRLYLFTTRDGDKAAKQFIMPDWHIWSTDDMVEWRHERTISPTETYMGESNSCWATETIYNNGKYYFYFSNANINSGVMVADHPAGPYKDALGRPMIDRDLTSTKEYDATLWVEEDGTTYMIWGHYVAGDPDLSYHIARLGEDMISLAESPRRVEITGDIEVLRANDKPNIHKYNGLYYLSAGTHYATSESIYGPYTRRGNSGNSQYGLTERGHGNYFKWNNQWFNTWCHFFMGKEVSYFRESYITYLHYRDNGEMVSDTVLLDNHFSNGVGQYDASWDRIEAEWFMRASKDGLKRESPSGGFDLLLSEDGEYIYFPNISSMGDKREIEMSVLVDGKCTIELRSDSVDGELIALCKLKGRGDGYKSECFKISVDGDKNSIYMVFKGGEKSSCRLDSFRFL